MTTGFLTATTGIVVAVLTYLVGPIIQRWLNRNKELNDTYIARETAAVAALKDALDGLQDENARLRQSIEWQDQQIKALRERVAELEDIIRGHAAKAKEHPTP